MKMIHAIFFCLISIVSIFANPSRREDDVLIQQLTKKIPNMGSVMLNDRWDYHMKLVVDSMLDDPNMSKLEKEHQKKFVNNFNVGTDSFNCPVVRSSSIPTSVHKLRPSDVKVIGAIGDSLSAGNGILASTVLGLLTQYRGSAFSMGGQQSIKQQISLPNILKLHNDKLVGYSIGSGSVGSANSKLNFAEPGKKALDLPQQARRLVDEMKKSSSGVDFNNDWKIITVFIGGNDVCDYCKDKKLHSAANYKSGIQQALDIFHKEVPRAFVNLLEVLDVSLVEELKTGSSICSTLVGGYLCRCAANPSSSSERQEIADLIKSYQSSVRELVSGSRYDTREDFTVVVQPFFRDTKPPRINGKYDISYFAPDCFHFSAKGHAEAAKALWNNMLEPVSKKSTQWKVNGNFLCPTNERPYFATAKN